VISQQYRVLYLEDPLIQLVFKEVEASPNETSRRLVLYADKLLANHAGSIVAGLLFDDLRSRVQRVASQPTQDLDGWLCRSRSPTRCSPLYRGSQAKLSMRSYPPMLPARKPIRLRLT